MTELMCVNSYSKHVLHAVYMLACMSQPTSVSSCTCTCTYAGGASKPIQSCYSHEYKLGKVGIVKWLHVCPYAIDPTLPFLLHFSPTYFCIHRTFMQFSLTYVYTLYFTLSMHLSLRTNPWLLSNALSSGVEQARRSCCMYAASAL